MADHSIGNEDAFTKQAQINILVHFIAININMSYIVRLSF